MAHVTLSPRERVRRIRHDLDRLKSASETSRFARSVIREIEDLINALSNDLENPNARIPPTR
jgi:hypothetical protein